MAGRYLNLFHELATTDGVGIVPVREVAYYVHHHGGGHLTRALAPSAGRSTDRSPCSARCRGPKIWPSWAAGGRGRARPVLGVRLAADVTPEDVPQGVCRTRRGRGDCTGRLCIIGVCRSATQRSFETVRRDPAGPLRRRRLRGNRDTGANLGGAGGLRAVARRTHRPGPPPGARPGDGGAGTVAAPAGCRRAGWNRGSARPASPGDRRRPKRREPLHGHVEVRGDEALDDQLAARHAGSRSPRPSPCWRSGRRVVVRVARDVLDLEVHRRARPAGVVEQRGDRRDRLGCAARAAAGCPGCRARRSCSPPAPRA